jgi:hypothetical protein
MFSGIDYPGLPEISDSLDNSGKGYLVSTINWEDYTIKPETKFKIGYSDNEIFLKYYVREDCIKAEMSLSNQKVYEDSCVEFFVSPGVDGVYYNFEFNCIGICLLGIGTGRANRTLADPDIISKIRRLPSMGTMPFGEKRGDFSWTLTIAIPFGIFIPHDVKDLKNKVFKANFYKCGDKLSSPHYLTWNPVKTDKPDFHQPMFFGELRFE